MRKKRFGKKPPASGDVALNITAMADIFTILLVFLLKSFTTGGITLTPSKGLLLPKAVAKQPDLNALKVEISENAVLIEGKPIIELKKFEFSRGDLLKNGVSKKLGEAVKTERQRQVAIAKENTDVKIDAKIIVIADQRAPYSTIKTVLASAAVHGYTDFKLAVITE